MGREFDDRGRAGSGAQAGSATEGGSVLGVLDAVTDAIHHGMDFKSIAEKVVDAVVAYAPYGGGSIFTLAGDGKTLELVAARGFPEELVELRSSIPLDGSFTGLCLREKRVLATDDLASESRGIRTMREALVRAGFAKAICVPLVHRDRPLGTMNLVLSAEATFGEDERATLFAVGKTIAVALANAHYLEQLREGQLRYDLATAAGKVGVWDWNLETGSFYLDGNVKALLGYREEEIPNDLGAWRSHLHPDDRPFVEAAMREHTEGRTPEFASEHRMLHKDGSVRWIMARGSAVRDASGRVVRVIGTDADITRHRELENERRELQEQMIHAEKLKSLGVLAGGVAHDFNNLLTCILGNASLATVDVAPRSAGSRAIEQIEAAARRAAELTQQLLAYSGKGAFVLEPVDLTALIDEMRELLKLSVSKKAILKFELSPDLPPIEADADQLRQVVLNLVTNASEALEERSGIVTVRTGVSDEQAAAPADPAGDVPRVVWCEVEDTGCGMDESVRQRIFDPFYTTKFTGRGLGLAAVLGIVRGHRGRIDLDTLPGQGSRIRALFPETGAAKANRGSRASFEHLGGGTVLVVDDEDGVRSLARTVLENVGFEVLTAKDGLEALHVFRRMADKIQLVLLDLSMPYLGGQEALEAIRRVSGDVRIILSSGYDAGDAVEKVRGQGLAGFLKKPYSATRLIVEVRRALQR